MDKLAARSVHTAPAPAPQRKEGRGECWLSWLLLGGLLITVGMVSWACDSKLISHGSADASRDLAAQDHQGPAHDTARMDSDLLLGDTVVNGEATVNDLALADRTPAGDTPQADLSGPSVCPNNVCEADESCTSCLADCGPCPREMIPGVRGFAATTGPFEGVGDPAVCVVNTLDWNDDGLVEDPDYGGSGLSVLTGSFKRCLTDYDQIARGQGRIILFEVGGTINAGGPYIEARLRDLGQTPRGIDYIWVAGQTAPPPGITLYNIKIACHGDHTIWQHLRFRLDDNGLDCLQAQGHKGFQATNYSGDPPPEHTIFDHNSVTYGIDNLASFSDHSTVTNNIFAYALRVSMHPKTYDYGIATATCPDDCACQYGESLDGHSKGVMMTGDNQVALIGNILAFNDDRNPLLSGGVSEIYLANNLIHKVTFPIMIADQSNPQTITAIGNVAQKTYSGSPSFATIWREPVMPGSMNYFEDNRCEGVSQTSPSDWSSVRLVSGVTDASKVTDPSLAARVPGFTPWPSAQVRGHVLTHAGARPSDPDAVDALVCDHVLNETGSFIDRPEDLPDPFPHMLDASSRNLAAEMINLGEWPMPVDPFGDSDGDGRANIVEWLNQLDEEVGGNENPGTYP